MTDQAVFFIIAPLHLLVVILTLTKDDFTLEEEDRFYRINLWVHRFNRATLFGWVLFLGIEYFLERSV